MKKLLSVFDRIAFLWQSQFFDQKSVQHSFTFGWLYITLKSKFGKFCPLIFYLDVK